MTLHVHPSGDDRSFTEFGPEPTTGTQVWINGVTLDIAPGFLYDFLHDVRWDHQEAITTGVATVAVPGWNGGVGGGLDLVIFGNSDQRGSSAFTQNYLHDLARFKVALFEAAQITIRHRTTPSPEGAAQSPAEYRDQFKTAVALIRKAAAAINALTKTVEESGSHITCWAEPGCQIVNIYARLTPTLTQLLSELPHFQTEISDAEAKKKELNRLANRREAEFNKWLKNKQREMNAQPS